MNIRSQTRYISKIRTVRRTRIKRRCFTLRNFLNFAVKLGRRRLIEANFVREAARVNCVKKAQRADRVNFGRIFRQIKADFYVRLQAAKRAFRRLIKM